MRKVLLAFLLLNIFFSIKAQNKISYYRSKGKLPMMSYSKGSDRLGGAKMNIIDTNILLKIIDSTHEFFTVQLSKNHTSYLEKEFAIPDTLVKPKNYYLCNSINIKSIEDSFDLVSINMEEKVPYKIWMENNPNKIMLQLYGVQSNINWINQRINTKSVKNVTINQTEDDVITVTIELSNKQHWGFSTSYIHNTLNIKVKHAPKPEIKNLIIAIDAGHGGNNKGTIGSKTKIEEKDYTLIYAKELEKLLTKKGAKVIMTRTTDTSFGNKDRILFLQQYSPHLLISLHFNASVKPEINGVSTYYKHIGFKPLAQSILQKMLELDLNEFGNIGQFNFSLNAITDFPNCLVEIAFLSNELDEEKVLRPKFPLFVAQKIYAGIKDFLKQSADD